MSLKTKCHHGSRRTDSTNPAIVLGVPVTIRQDFGGGVAFDDANPRMAYLQPRKGCPAAVLQEFRRAAAIAVTTLLVFLTTSASAAVRYVDANGASPTAPYGTWATAATNIQDAIDVADDGDEIVVTNGVYQTGGRVVDAGMTNRVAVTKPLTVRSVNGPEVTVIAGYQVPGAFQGLGDSAVRCVYLGEGAALVGFTLTNGATLSSGDYYLERSGGGVWCASAGAVVSNCVFSGNSAFHEAGGAYHCTLNNCVLTGNLAAYAGGGAYVATLNNCIVYYNVAVQSGANYQAASFNYSCTTPLPPFSAANFDNPPLFVDPASGNFRLQSNSPCINTGNNTYVAGGADLDGRPRVVGGSVDMGAYEFQPGVSGHFIAWLQQYGLLTDGSADTADPDGDRLNNWQEWRAGTDPTNAQSVLRVLTPPPAGADSRVRWESVPGRSYSLEWSTSAWFYRVRVEE